MQDDISFLTSRVNPFAKSHGAVCLQSGGRKPAPAHAAERTRQAPVRPCGTSSTSKALQHVGATAVHTCISRGERGKRVNASRPHSIWIRGYPASYTR
jgi:hypothetical protein